MADAEGWSRTAISTVALLNFLCMGVASFVWGARPGPRGPARAAAHAPRGASVRRAAPGLEPLEEIALVKGDGLRERRRGRSRDPLREGGDIHGHGGGLEGHRARPQAQRRRVSPPEALPERVERLAKARAGRRLDGAAPEQGRQLVTGAGGARGHGQVGQKSLRLLGGEGERCTGVQASPKAPPRSVNESRAILSPTRPSPLARATIPGHRLGPSTGGGLHTPRTPATRIFTLTATPC
jgi:hypothetical protein